jgi:hypothetical protein
VYGEVRPSIKVKDVLRNCERDCSSLGTLNHLVIMGGVNDTARNKTKNYSKNLGKCMLPKTVRMLLTIYQPGII